MLNAPGGGLPLKTSRASADGLRPRRQSTRAVGKLGFRPAWCFVSYKAKRAGVPVVFVDPRNTSRQCAACGCIDKKNRPNQATFLCVACGHAANADTNAAINIRSRALVAQGNVMCPVCSLLKRQ